MQTKEQRKLIPSDEQYYRISPHPLLIRDVETFCRPPSHPPIARFLLSASQSGRSTSSSGTGLWRPCLNNTQTSTWSSPPDCSTPFTTGSHTHKHTHGPVPPWCWWSAGLHLSVDSPLDSLASFCFRRKPSRRSLWNTATLLEMVKHSNTLMIRIWFVLIEFISNVYTEKTKLK